MTGDTSPLLEMAGISKEFPGVKALDEVSLTLHRGEVLALLGENGAGKSTLIKTLGGSQRPDRGVIRIDGAARHIHSATEARRLGIAVIYQEFNLVPDLTVRENLFLGREKTTAGFVNRREEAEITGKWLGQLGMDIDRESPCRELTVAQQQVVEIARALSTDARILVMDEPSAVLSNQEVDRLFEIVRDLRSRGIGIIYISHRLEEIFSLADRYLVLRDGKYIAEGQVADTNRKELIEKMVGRPLESEFPPRSVKRGEERLRVEDLVRGEEVRGVSFSVRAGEVLGVAGLVGAGRTETMRLIAGADWADGGRIFVDGRPVTIRSPRKAIRAGICLLTENRKEEGLIVRHRVRENFGLPNLRRYSRGPVLQARREGEELKRYTAELKIRGTGPDQLAGELSGGNQQKVVLSKWLARDADILIFDEPTRGIDVGAKWEIYQWINRLAAEGKAIIMVSSELPEILGMSDRILVMHEGRVAGEIEDASGATQEDVLSLAMGEAPAVS